MSDNIQVAKDIYAAFSRGDLESIMRNLSDDLQEFGILTDSRLVPWHVQATSRKDVPEFFKAIAESSDVTNFNARDFAAGGDYVYCTVSFDVSFKHNGQRLTITDSLQRFAFKNGKVTGWRGSEDTASVGAAYNAVGV